MKFSANWKKAKAKALQVRVDSGNARRDYLHKASTTISQNHAIVCIEYLQIRNISKPSKGNTEQGSKVRQKSGLNRAILDQGFGEFRRKLDYKLAWRVFNCRATTTTEAERAKCVIMYRARVARHKPSLSVSNVAMKIEPI